MKIEKLIAENMNLWEENIDIEKKKKKKRLSWPYFMDLADIPRSFTRFQVF